MFEQSLAKLQVRAQLSPPMQVSKWLKVPLLLDIHEMEALFDFLGDFYIIQTSGLMPIGSEIISKDAFLDCYFHYVHSLKQGLIPTDKRLNTFFSAIFTVDINALYTVQVKESKQMVGIEKPVIQLQNHRFICGQDKKFHSMVFGPNSIYWGIQFSYPQLFQNIQLEVSKVNDQEDFPNTKFFKSMQKWVREYTSATPFSINQEPSINVPLRLGKDCFKWINSHPQLRAANLEVNKILKF